MLFQHFDWDLTYQVLFLHFAQPSYELEGQALKTGRCSYVGLELIFLATNFLSKSL